MKVLRDTSLMFQRQITLLRRSPLWIFLGVAHPVIYMILFTPLLKPALANYPGGGSMTMAYRVYVPGMLVALALGGGLYVGFNLLGEIGSGVIERARVTPISRSALLLGKALRDLVQLTMQAAMIVILSLFFGVFVYIQNLLLAYVLLALISLTASGISYGIAIKVKNGGVLSSVINNLAMPLMLLSGTLLPIAIAPLWLRDTANANPFNWAVTGVRSLFVNNGGNPEIWQALIIMVCVAALALGWATRVFAKAVR